MFLFLQVFALPDNVAFKFEAKPGKKKYFFLEAHIDNPEKSEGVLLNFGFKGFFADKPRHVHDTFHVAN